MGSNAKGPTDVVGPFSPGSSRRVAERCFRNPASIMGVVDPYG
jgi:hypothetical protein